MESYINYEYYVSGFGGSLIPESEFDALASAATDIIGILVSRPVSTVTDSIRRAAAYEAETVIFNSRLSPAQERNLEKVLKARVMDRIALIQLRHHDAYKLRKAILL